MAKKILVVDDDADILTLVEAVLSEEGYEVVTAHDGRAALEDMRAGQTPNLILLDLAMPIMSGWEFIQQLNESKLAPDTPIVVMTASPQVDERVVLPLVAGHINKPFDLDDLVACAATYLGGPVPSNSRFSF